jgi:hypothetical protein
MTQPSIPQRPPYEDVTPAVARPIAAAPVPQPAQPAYLPGRVDGTVSAPRVVPKREQVPDVSGPYWSEARIFRIAATLMFTALLVGFVIAASRACPPWLAWAPFLVGALPYGAFAALAWRKHLDDESKARERRERWAHSRLDVVSLGDAEVDPDTGRYR